MADSKAYAPSNQVPVHWYLEDDPADIEIPLEERFSKEELEEIERCETAAFEMHVEQLAIVENIKQEARAEAGFTEVRRTDILELKIDDMEHYSPAVGQSDEYEYQLGSTEVLIRRPNKDEGRCLWDLRAAGTLFKGRADSPEEALATVKERYVEAVPPARMDDREAVLFPHPLDLEYDGNTKAWKWEASTTNHRTSVLASISPGIEYDNGLDLDYVVTMIRTSPGNDAFRTDIAEDFGQAYRKLYEFACESLPVSGIETVPGSGRAIGIAEIGPTDYRRAIMAAQATERASRQAEPALQRNNIPAQIHTGRSGR